MNHHSSLSHVTYLLIVLSLVGSCLSHLGQKVRIAHMYGKRDKQDRSEFPLTNFLGNLGQRLPTSIGESYHPNRRAGSDLNEPLFAHILGRDLGDLYSYYSNKHTLDQRSNMVLENKPYHKDIFEMIDEYTGRSNKNNEFLSTKEVYMPVFSTKNMSQSSPNKHIVRKLYSSFSL